MTPPTAGYHLTNCMRYDGLRGKLLSYGHAEHASWAKAELVYARITAGCEAMTISANRTRGPWGLLGRHVCSHGSLARSAQHQWISDILKRYLPHVYARGLARDPVSGVVANGGLPYHGEESVMAMARSLAAGGWDAPIRVALPNTGGVWCGRPAHCARSSKWWGAECVWQRLRDLASRCQAQWVVWNGTQATCTRLALGKTSASTSTAWLERRRSR